MVSALGIFAGGLVHVAAAVAGVSAILATSGALFSAMKWIGAVYLFYLGVKTLVRGGTGPVAATALPNDRARFWRGAMVNLLNPKAIGFFVAFLPQFAEPDIGPLPPQLLILGMTFTLIALVSDALYGVFSGALSDMLNRSDVVGRWLSRVSGFTLIGLGAAAGLVGRTA